MSNEPEEEKESDDPEEEKQADEPEEEKESDEPQEVLLEVRPDSEAQGEGQRLSSPVGPPAPPPTVQLSVQGLFRATADRIDPTASPVKQQAALEGREVDV